jgi:hypothetical protein
MWSRPSTSEWENSSALIDPLEKHLRMLHTSNDVESCGCGGRLGVFQSASGGIFGEAKKCHPTLVLTLLTTWREAPLGETIFSIFYFLLRSVDCYFRATAVPSTATMVDNNLALR